uniref:YdeI/OmpD-associated family protein n=1 Tax=Steinernema glaseri TaxID=37863 RepID=A0A1I7ZK15_9BILA
MTIEEATALGKAYFALLQPKEKRTSEYKWIATMVSYPDTPFHQQLLEAAKEYGDRTALVRKIRDSKTPPATSDRQ